MESYIENALGGKHLKVKLGGKEYNTYFSIDRYSIGRRTAIELICSEDQSPFCTLTTNLPHVELEEQEVLIKTWSENEEIAKAALTSGLFRDTGKRVSTGFVQAEVWEVL